MKYLNNTYLISKTTYAPLASWKLNDTFNSNNKYSELYETKHRKWISSDSFHLAFILLEFILQK